MRHNGIMGEAQTADAKEAQRDLLQRCADLCSMNAKGKSSSGDVASGTGTFSSSGCVGFTVSTLFQCDLHVACNAGSLVRVTPDTDVIRVSYAMGAIDMVE